VLIITPNQPQLLVSSMAPHLSKDLHNRVVKWWMERGMTYRELAIMAGCSIGMIYTILDYHYTYGQSTNPLSEHTGWPCLLDAGDSIFLDQLLEREPMLYLDEIWRKLEILLSLLLLYNTLLSDLISPERLYQNKHRNGMIICVLFGKGRWLNMTTLTVSYFLTRVLSTT